MAITLRNDAKSEIIKILRQQGYATYARLVDYFDIYLTDDPKVIGYMIPGKAKIVLNMLLDIEQVSTIIRHEILHEYLTHGPRQEKFSKEHPELGSSPELSNIAADFEISNKGYTSADKNIARRIKLGDKVLRGLVTEDEYPGWENMSYEEMYHKLLEQHKNDQEKLKSILDQLNDVSQKDLDDMISDAQDISKSAKGSKESQQQSKQSDSGETDVGDSEKPSSSTNKDASKDDLKKAADAAKDAAEKLKKELSDAEAKSENSADVFDTPEEQQAKSDIIARAQLIRDFIDDLKNKKSIDSENSRAISKEREEKAAQDSSRYMGSGLQQFKLNLNRFIATQVDELGEPELTYRQLDPRYEDSDFIMPGKMTHFNKQIPVINVYHDVSASFADPNKTAAALKAIESLNRYVRDGEIEMKLFYFADRISSNKNTAGSGTRGKPIQEHILKTRPTNVIIITDGDIHDCVEPVKVPGAVWMLFYESESQNIKDNVIGKKQNKYYDITY